MTERAGSAAAGSVDAVCGRLADAEPAGGQRMLPISAINLAANCCTAHTVQQRETVGQNPGAERAQQKVFQRCFVGALLASQKPGQHVEAERHGLQPKEQHDQIHARSHEHHADARQQEQRVVLAFLLFFDVQVADGKKNHQRGGGEKNAREHQREPINEHRIVETDQAGNAQWAGSRRPCTSELHE